MQKLHYIDTTDELHALAGRLQEKTWLAVDTEFERSRTYYPQLCLLQIADDNEAACIDPMVLDDLGPITALFENPSITKVLHAASQDMEVFLHYLHVLPAPVFDTQIAATLLGYPDQIGYARLVSAELGVTLDKKHTRADWTKRPLSEGELDYAADDVRYLYQLYASMTGELERRGRRGWLDGEMQALTEPGQYTVQPREAFRRCKGWRRLRPTQRGVLREVADWRERRAVSADRPRRWIMKDEIALDLARHSPPNLKALGRIRDISEKTLKRHGNDLLDAVARGREKPINEDTTEVKPDARQEPILDILMGALRQCALDTGIAPAALAKKRDLEGLVCGERDIPLLRGWRRQAAGEWMLGILNGETGLRVHNGTLQMEATEDRRTEKTNP